MKINTNKKSGFTLVEIMIVVAIIGLLAAIAIPNFVRARQTAQAKSCVNNMRLIDSAKQQTLLENPAAALDIATLTPYLGRGAAGTFPACPMTPLDLGASYTIGAATVNPLCANNPASATQPAINHILPL